MLRKMKRSRLFVVLVAAILVAWVIIVKRSSRRIYLKAPPYSIDNKTKDTENTKTSEGADVTSETKAAAEEAEANEIDVKREETDEKGPDTNSVKRLPNAYILGAEKSGATPLTAFIGLHPNVVTVHGRDINFFGDPENYKKGIDWYKSKLPNVAKDDILIENAPDYFYSTKASELMREVFSSDNSVKLVIIARDPVKRLISEYADMAARMKANGQKPQSFEEAVIDHGVMLVNTSYAPIIHGIYVNGLVKWAKRFNRNQTHFVDGDNFITSPLVELRKLENFLGVGNKIMDNQFHFNNTSGFFCMKTTDGKSRCYMRPPGWETPTIDQKKFEIVKNYYIHHNKRYFYVSKQRYNWVSNITRSKT